MVASFDNYPIVVVHCLINELELSSLAVVLSGKQSINSKPLHFKHINMKYLGYKFSELMKRNKHTLHNEGNVIFWCDHFWYSGLVINHDNEINGFIVSKIKVRWSQKRNVFGAWICHVIILRNLGLAVLEAKKIHSSPFDMDINTFHVSCSTSNTVI